MKIQKLNNSVEIQLSDKGSDLYIFFGGIAAGIAMPPYEFYNASRILDEHKIFVRDFKQSWYQNGLPEIGKELYDTANFIKQKIQEINPNDVYFVGNSMGGYAAILFSCLIDQGKVIAFAPQTFITPGLRFKNNDYRWARQIFWTQLSSYFKPHIWDLKHLMTNTSCKPKVSIFVSTSDKLDVIHASHLGDMDGVHIHEFKGGGHGVVKHLRDEGLLPGIMTGQYLNLGR